MFEKYLITYCSPTLASLKSANLFTVKYVNESELCLQLDVWNAHFRSKGLCLMVLRRQEHTALIYIYRHSLLSKELKKPGVAAFLAGYGYVSKDYVTVSSSNNSGSTDSGNSNNGSNSNSNNNGNSSSTTIQSGTVNKTYLQIRVIIKAKKNYEN